MGTVKVKHQKIFGSVLSTFNIRFSKKSLRAPRLGGFNNIKGLNIADVECAKRSDLCVDEEKKR